MRDLHVFAQFYNGWTKQAVRDLEPEERDILMGLINEDLMRAKAKREMR